MAFQEKVANISQVHVLSPNLNVDQWLGSEVHPIPTLVYSVDMHMRIKTSEHAHLDLQPGEAVCIRPGTLHQHLESRHKGMYYTQGFLETYSDFRLVDHEDTYRGAADRALLWDMFQEILDEPENEQRCALLINFIRNVNDDGTSKIGGEHPSAARMHEFIRINAHRDISIKDIIGASGLADAQAFAVYKQSYGLTPLHHLLKRRVYMAQAYLRSGMDRKSVVEKSGFQSSRQMNRAFHRFVGMSPRDWLRELRAENEKK